MDEQMRERFGFSIDGPTETVRVLTWDSGGCRPANDTEIALWDALAALSQPAAQEIDELKTICAETYQVVGSLASDLGIFGSCLQLGKVLDNLSEQKRVHNDVLPWPSFEAQGDSSHPAGGEFGGVQVHPMNYKGMWLASVSTLAKIDALLGLPEDGCNDPDVTLGALEDYMSGIKDIVGSSAFTIEDVRGWIAQGQARALAIDPDAAILTKSTCTMCNGTRSTSSATRPGARVTAAWGQRFMQSSTEVRPMTYAQYEAAKAFWLRANPNATPAQYEAACKRLARVMGV